MDFSEIRKHLMASTEIIEAHVNNAPKPRDARDPISTELELIEQILPVLGILGWSINAFEKMQPNINELKLMYARSCEREKMVA